jgi:pimeloyl-ACP methyl ester carboxylesterase
MKCIPPAFGLLLLVRIGLVAQVAPGQPLPTPHTPAPAIEWAELPDDLPQSLRDSVRFGYLEVPEDHDSPDGPRIRIAIALLPALSPERVPDPLVYVFGGPGWAAIRANVADFARMPRYQPYREHRDVIVLDQRGHGYSGPGRCDVDLSGNRHLMSEAARRKYLASLDECRKQVQAHNVRLETLSAAQSARDLEWLRRALGAPALNLYAASYGARVAAEALRLVPSAVRAVHFSAPSPPGKIGTAGGNYTAADEALRALIRRCAEQPDCHAAYPRLDADLEAVLSEVKRAPFRLPVPAEVDIEGEIIIDEQLLRVGLSQLLANRNSAARAPFIIRSLAGKGVAGSTDLLRQMGGPSREEERQQYALETMTAFWCNDGVINRNSAEWLQEECRALLGEAYTGREVEPIRSDLPALITTGEWDPNTPPSHAHFLASGLSRSHVVIIPTQGHDAPQPDCVYEISRAFFDAPQRAPDMTCVPSIPLLRFVTDGAGGQP